MMSHGWPIPRCSSAPRPVLPRKPVAWHSSMKIKERYFWAKSAISFRGAMSPSMLKTLSVTISLILAPWVSWRSLSRSVGIFQDIRSHSRFNLSKSSWEEYLDVTESPWMFLYENSLQTAHSCYGNMNQYMFIYDLLSDYLVSVKYILLKCVVWQICNLAKLTANPVKV